MKGRVARTWERHSFENGLGSDEEACGWEGRRGGWKLKGISSRR